MTLVSDFFSQRVIIGFGNEKVFFFFNPLFFQVCISRKKSSVSLCVSLFVCCLVILRLWGTLVQCRVTWRDVATREFCSEKRSRNMCECAFVSVFHLLKRGSLSMLLSWVIVAFIDTVVVFLLEFILYSEHPAGGAGRWFSNEARRWRMFSRRCLMEKIEGKN